jgi:hypothetical protein
MRAPGNYLVLWESKDASRWKGKTPGVTRGNHAKGLIFGDRAFISSCDDQELYLLGCLEVKRVDRMHSPPAAYGPSLAGKFQYIPLRNHKWKLRFEKTRSTRLRRNASLLWQVKSRRILTSESAILLLRILRKQSLPEHRIVRRFREEGRRLMRPVSKAERDSRVREAALRQFGTVCRICGVDPGEKYGPFAKNCVEVHHLKPLGSSGGRKRRPTRLSDVIVVCPNCHRALHMWDDPAAWQEFRKECGL